MISLRIEQLKHEYTGQHVVIEGGRPEHARFQGLVGQVKTVNMSGRALVQFDGRGDRSWYDIELDYLKVVDPPPPPPGPASGAGPAGAERPRQEAPPRGPQTPAGPRPSSLELARQEKAEQQSAAAEERPPAASGTAAPAATPAGKRPVPGPQSEPPDPARLSALERARLEKTAPPAAARGGPAEDSPLPLAGEGSGVRASGTGET